MVAGLVAIAETATGTGGGSESSLYSLSRDNITPDLIEGSLRSAVGFLLLVVGISLSLVLTEEIAPKQ